MQRRTVLAAALITLGVAFATLVGVSWALAARSPAASSIPTPTTDPAYSALHERGLALFVAKGCITCHHHQEALARYRPAMSGLVGPDLTYLSERFPPRPGSLSYLRRWLKDPAALKPDTPMPTLGLSDEEIEALLRFLLTEERFR